jgi:hypothetical protein
MLCTVRTFISRFRNRLLMPMLCSWSSFITRDNQHLLTHEALDLLDKCLRYGSSCYAIRFLHPEGSGETVSYRRLHRAPVSICRVFVLSSAPSVSLHPVGSAVKPKLLERRQHSRSYLIRFFERHDLRARFGSILRFSSRTCFTLHCD